MKHIIYFIISICIFFLMGCDNDTVENINSIVPTDVKNNDYTIDINTTRSDGNILELPKDHDILTRSSDPFTEIRNVECFESVVLPELQPHIWIGNILTKKSIVDCNYSPLVYTRTSPITVSLTLPGTESKTIERPSNSQFLTYIQEQIDKGSFSQNGEFKFTIEQFSSYNELKRAFGSNVNVDALFWNSSSSSQEEKHLISKASGLYVKFFQSSFKIIMDYPEKQLANIPSNLRNEAVYINSITYGRLGILTVETNEAIHTANRFINKTFKKLFVSSFSSLTSEEKSFLDGCDFRVYLISGNGATSVETFSGYDGFIQHIKKGQFSREEPGAPLFCTFNHLKDNSPVSIKFKYSIKKDPLYVELEKKNDGVYLNFYRNRSKTPTIANPKIVFPITIKWKKDFFPASYAEYLGFGDLVGSYQINKDFQNADYHTSLKVSDIRKFYVEEHWVAETPHGVPCDLITQREILLNNGYGFEILGTEKLGKIR